MQSLYTYEYLRQTLNDNSSQYCYCGSFHFVVLWVLIHYFGSAVLFNSTSQCRSSFLVMARLNVGRCSEDSDVFTICILKKKINNQHFLVILITNIYRLLGNSCRNFPAVYQMEYKFSIKYKVCFWTTSGTF
jgi:hypothetical protein